MACNYTINLYVLTAAMIPNGFPAEFQGPLTNTGKPGKWLLVGTACLLWFLPNRLIFAVMHLCQVWWSLLKISHDSISNFQYITLV